MTIGDNIRKARKSAGLTQNQLANKLGLSVMSIRRYEAGSRDLKTNALNRIAAALGVTLAELVHGVDGWYAPLYITEGEEGISAPVTVREDKELQEKILEPHNKNFGIGNREKLLEYFGKLNETGQAKAVERLAELSEVPRYCKEGNDDA